MNPESHTPPLDPCAHADRVWAGGGRGKRGERWTRGGRERLRRCSSQARLAMGTRHPAMPWPLYAFEKRSRRERRQGTARAAMNRSSRALHHRDQPSTLLYSTLPEPVLAAAALLHCTSFQQGGADHPSRHDEAHGALDRSKEDEHTVAALCSYLAARMPSPVVVRARQADASNVIAACPYTRLGTTPADV